MREIDVSYATLVPATGNTITKGLFIPMFRSSCFHLFGVCSLALCCSFPAAADQAGSPPSALTPGEIVVRTPEDIQTGRENVIRVAEQLRRLFAPQQKTRRSRPAKEQPYLKVLPGANGRSTLIYRCRYNTASKLSTSVESLITNDGYVEATEEQNMLVINDKRENIAALSEALPAIDASSPQVLIEAKVVEIMISDGMERNMSLTFNQAKKITVTDEQGNAAPGVFNNSAGMSTSSLAPAATGDGGGVDWIFTSGNKSVHAAFQWLLNAQDAKVLSSPTIVVARNEKSTISNGQDVPIQSQTNTNGSIQTSTTFKRVGVTLEVTPKMINADNVTLLVSPEVSNIQSYQTISQGTSSYQVPVISIRSIETNVKLEDGQTIVMGGLYNNRESVSQERIPFLSDIPYFGEIFTSKYREKELIQLLFFLRVHILTADDLVDGILFDPDEIARSSNAIGEIIRKSPTLPQTENTMQQVKHEFIERDPLQKNKSTTGDVPAGNPKR